MGLVKKLKKHRNINTKENLNMKTELHLLYMVIFGILFSGCATMIDGANQKVWLMAQDRQSVVATIGKEKVQLPAEVELPRKGVLIEVLAVDNAGYKDSRVHSSSIGATIANQSVARRISTGIGGVIFIIPINLIPNIVDAISGAAYQYGNEQLIIPVYPQKCNIK